MNWLATADFIDRLETRSRSIQHGKSRRSAPEIFPRGFEAPDESVEVRRRTRRWRVTTQVLAVLLTGRTAREITFSQSEGVGSPQ